MIHLQSGTVLCLEGGKLQRLRLLARSSINMAPVESCGCERDESSVVAFT